MTSSRPSIDSFSLNRSVLLDEANDTVEAEVVALAQRLLGVAASEQRRAEKREGAQIARLMGDLAGKGFLFAMVDETFRSTQPGVAAKRWRGILSDFGVPRYPGWHERALMALGAFGSRFAPGIVMPLVQVMMRAQTSKVILSGEEKALQGFLARRKSEGFSVNLNHLGEAVLGEEEAAHRLEEALRFLARPDVAYLSIKISAIFSQINLLAWDETLGEIKTRLRCLYRAALPQGKFVNLDMEEYRDLALTIAAFTQVLDEPEFAGLEAGIVLQAYLPDSFGAQQGLVAWARGRMERGGAGIKIRLVKGANLAMERVEAELHGWQAAPYASKPETDANFRRMLEWGCQAENARVARLGVASHNLFDVALALVLREKMGVKERVEIEMLEGMAPPIARAVRAQAGGLLLYAPVVKRADFLSALAYLIRRLDENTSEDNFLRDAFGLSPDSATWHAQRAAFETGWRNRHAVFAGSRRHTALEPQPEKTGGNGSLEIHSSQDGTSQSEPVENGLLESVSLESVSLESKPGKESPENAFSPELFARAPIKSDLLPDVLSESDSPANASLQSESFEPSVLEGVALESESPENVPFDGEPSQRAAFRNEPDSDWTQPDVRAALQCALNAWRAPDLPVLPPLDEVLETARRGQVAWQQLGVAARAAIVERAGDVLARGRFEAIACMRADAKKAVPEADAEASEAIDFARYYARHSVPDGVETQPLGVVVVTPPWNFPYAIPGGGVLAALVAGNAVILKPAPETAHTAFLLARQLWQAGVPREVLQFFACDDGQTGRALICDSRVAAVILTGSLETARMFQAWRPSLRLFAETSGKNALVISAQADREAAIKDLVKSAFGHAGQKCSAASLAIIEAEVYDSPDFRRQLRDCAHSLFVGSASDPRSLVTPTVQAPSKSLRRALTTLDEGEEWLLEPRQIGDECGWSPGIKLGVRGGSWFHQTECFGPVLGLMRAHSLSHALELQNATRFGLTAGLHSLDPREIAQWIEAVEAGNLYINRGTTGAVVGRQPFGGWKASSIGEGAKAGGPNYAWSFLHLSDVPDVSTDFAASYREAWETHFSRSHDPSGLRSESNVFRYRPCRGVILRLPRRDEAVIERAQLAASLSGAALLISLADEESDADFAARLPALCARFEWMRTVEGASDEVLRAAHEAGFNWIDAPISAHGRVELRFWLREQAVSQTRHRYGQVSEFQPDSRRGL